MWASRSQRGRWRARLTATLRRPTTWALLAVLLLVNIAVTHTVLNVRAQNGAPLISGVTVPAGGVWLKGTVEGHWWQPDNVLGLCRLDPSPGATSGFALNTATCDTTAATAGQAAAAPVANADGTTFVYVADEASKSGGPVRVTFDPTLDGGKGGIVPKSGILIGGASASGLFSDATKSFRNSSVAIGPCFTSSPPGCYAVYAAFIKSKNIVRITNPNLDPSQQRSDLVSKTADRRKGVQFGIATFNHPPDTSGHVVSDLYIAELGGIGVSMIPDIGACPPVDPGNLLLGGCISTITPITSFFPGGVAVLNNPDGSGKYVYVADSPRTGPSTVLRYDPKTGIQDALSTNVPPYTSPLDGSTVSTYQNITGLGVRQDTGDLYIGDDPTAFMVTPPTGMGHLWIVPGGAALDCIGTPTAPCSPVAPTSSVKADLYAWGATSPKGGGALIPGGDADHTLHLWVTDHSAGICRMDAVPGTALHAYNYSACDDATVGSPGQIIYDPIVNQGIAGVADGTHFVYVTQDDHLSPGVWRFIYDPSADNGNGLLLPEPVVMAPNGGLGGHKAVGIALGPDDSLYVGDLTDGFIRRINNPRSDPRVQTVDVVAQTQDKRGINGSIAFLGADLYLPENRGFTFVPNAVGCGLNGSAPCATQQLPIGTFGLIFGAGVAVDQINGLVYASDSPGGANATIWQYDRSKNQAIVYVTEGNVPAAGSANATVWCALTCKRPFDPNLVPGGTTGFHFASGMTVNQDTGDLFIFDDPTAGARSGRGRVWVAPYNPLAAIAPPSPTAPKADMAIALSHPGAFTAGGTGTFNIVVGNNGPTATPGPTTVTDTLPTGLTLVSGVGTGWNCAAAGQTVTCTNTAALIAGASSTITLTVAVDPAAGPTITDSATVAGSVPDPNAANDTATDVVSLVTSASADLALTMLHGASFVPGQFGIYTATVINNGPSQASAPIKITDTLPAGLSFLTGSGTGWSCLAVGQTVTCTNTQPISAGTTSTVGINVGVSSTAPSSVTNTATVTGVEADPNPANNTATDPTTVTALADLALSATALPDPIKAKGLLTYTITLTNNGPSAASGVVLTFAAPSNVAFLRTNSSIGKCVRVNTTVTCTVGKLTAIGPSATATITIVVRPLAAGAVGATVTAISTLPDPNTANNTLNLLTVVN